jgi:aspartate aminotransferase
MAVARKIKEAMAQASWIRKMFEEGARLKAERGSDKVLDFSLGNPCLEPPDSYLEALREHLDDRTPGKYAYMPNAGYWETRKAVAAHLSRTRGTAIEADHVVMTCGAGGGLNVVLKTLLDPGDEVVVVAPYFPEYLFYIDNHGGIPTIVPAREDFLLDLAAIEGALTRRTCAVILNSPNNPTGRLYPQGMIDDLGRLLAGHSRSSGRPIYLISDEPYGDIVYDGRILPDVLGAYSNTILVNSYSKSLSIPGERLGYVAVHPGAADLSDLLGGLVFSNRILGFVNAPATAQNVIRKIQGVHIEVGQYQRRRDMLCDGLSDAGYRFFKPEGAFYLFPEAPGRDDIAFAHDLLVRGVLVVPGTGFGAPGYFRIAYCVEESTIRRSLPVFKEVLGHFSSAGP